MERCHRIRAALAEILSGTAFAGVTASVIVNDLPSRVRSIRSGMENVLTRVSKSEQSASLYLKLTSVDPGKIAGGNGPRPPALFDFDAHLRLGASGASVRVEEGTGHRVSADEITAIHRLVGVGTQGGIDDAEDLRVASEKVSALLAGNIRTALRTVSGSLQIIHDAEPTRLPWETMADGEDLAEADSYPALRGGISRLFVSTRARRLIAEPPGERLRVLMVIDPTGDLKGARKEFELLKGILQGKGNVDVDYLEKSAANRTDLIRKLEGNVYHILHYAGHSAFDASNPEQAGLLLHGEEYFTANDVLGLVRFPPVVVFNSCESARVRRRGTRSAIAAGEEEDLPEFSASAAAMPMQGGAGTARQRQELRDRPRGVLSIAEGFLLSGVEHFLGTFWPVGDASAKNFSSRLYTGLANGETLGKAMLEARTELFNDGKADWANYIHYGDPTAVLFENPTKDI